MINKLMINKNHTYWIPTNRDVRKSIESYITEIDYWFKLSGDVIPMFVLDSGNSQIEATNSQTIEQIKQQYPHLHVTHMTLQHQREMVQAILAYGGFKAELIDWIAPGETNYGAMMNKIALLAAAFGSDCIHRRDSDTVLQPNCPMPIEFEMAVLQNKGHIPLHRRPAVVGSGYVGEWNMDLKPFVELSPDLFSTFWTCLGVDEKFHQLIYDTFDEDAKAYYQGDSIKYTDKDGFNLPDAGNVAFSSFYRWFPCLPSNAMSSDYTWFRFAKGLNLPMVHHERRVVHEYHKQRHNKHDTYLRSMLKYCDLRPIYAATETAMQDGITPDDLQSIEQLQHQVADMLEQAINDDKSARQTKLSVFLNDFIRQRFADWADKTEPELDAMYNSCIDDYRNHIALIRQWQGLMNAASECGEQLQQQVYPAPLSRAS